jgi:hypothetical protein
MEARSDGRLATMTLPHDPANPLMIEINREKFFEMTH